MALDLDPDCGERLAPKVRSMLERDRTITDFELNGDADDPESYPDVSEAIRGLHNNPSIKRLEVYGIQLSNKAAGPLYEVLACNTVLKDLSLRSVNMRPNHISGLSRGLKANASLQKLYLQRASMSCHDFAVLLEAIDSRSVPLLSLVLHDSLSEREGDLASTWASKTIEEALANGSITGDLDLSGSTWCERSEGFGAMMRGLARNSSIRTISLRHNSLNQNHASQLQWFVKERSASLSHLDLTGSRLRGRPLRSVADSLRGNPAVLSRLSIHSGRLASDDLSVLLEALTTEHSGLLALNLDDNDLSDAPPGNAIEESLRDDNVLEKLTLSFCSLAGSETLDSLLRGLSRNSSIISLDLSFNDLGDKDAEKVANMLLRNTSLQELKLGFNHIGGQGINYIVAALKQHPLTYLSLEGNEINCIRNLAEFLASNDSLETLDLSYIVLGDAAATHLASALTRNSTLKVLIVEGCRIGDEGASAFGNMMRQNSSLKELQLKYNSGITENGLRSLLGALRRRNTSLVKLHL